MPRSWRWPLTWGLSAATVGCQLATPHPRRRAGALPAAVLEREPFQTAELVATWVAGRSSGGREGPRGTPTVPSGEKGRVGRPRFHLEISPDVWDAQRSRTGGTAGRRGELPAAALEREPFQTAELVATWVAGR